MKIPDRRLECFIFLVWFYTVCWVLVPSSWQVQDARSALRTLISLTPIFCSISGVHVRIVQQLLLVPFRSVPERSGFSTIPVGLRPDLLNVWLLELAWSQSRPGWPVKKNNKKSHDQLFSSFSRWKWSTIILETPHNIVMQLITWVAYIKMNTFTHFPGGNDKHRNTT